MTDLEQLRAENARLREALLKIERHRRECHEYDDDCGHERRSFDAEDVKLMETMARAALSADPAPVEAVLSDNDLYYLRAIQRRLNEFSEALDGIDALSIGGEAFADERDWLDCFIERIPTPVAGVTVPAGAVEALANYQQGDMDGILVLVSRQAIEECLPALRALAGENDND